MPVSKTVDRGSNPRGPAKIKQKEPYNCMVLFVLVSDQCQKRILAGAAAMSSFSPKKEDREAGSRTLSRICT